MSLEPFAVQKIRHTCQVFGRSDSYSIGSLVKQSCLAVGLHSVLGILNASAI